jgi:hypothetical protein
VQKSFYSLILDRRIGAYELPPGSVVIGAGNRATDNALARPMPSALGEIYVNPRAGLTGDEWRFVLAHEMLHAALRHGDRVGGRDPYLWNVACDYVINGWLLELSVGAMPDGLLHDPSLAGLSAEAVYDRIATDLRRLRKLATLRGRGLGDVLTEPLPHSGEAATAVDLDEFYRKALIDGLTCHEARRGLLPAGLEAEIKALEHPPLPWDARLARWFDEHVAAEAPRRSYARPSRRQSASPDIPRPGRLVPVEESPRHTFGVVLDTSASMPERLLGKARANPCASTAGNTPTSCRAAPACRSPRAARFSKYADTPGTGVWLSWGCDVTLRLRGRRRVRLLRDRRRPGSSRRRARLARGHRHQTSASSRARPRPGHPAPARARRGERPGRLRPRHDRGRGTRRHDAQRERHHESRARRHADRLPPPSARRAAVPRRRAHPALGDPRGPRARRGRPEGSRGMSPVAPDRPAVSQAFAKESERVVALVRGCGTDPKTAVPGLAWSLAQLVAHLTGAYLVFGQAVRGEFENAQLEEAVAQAATADPALPAVVAASNAYAVDLLTVEDVQTAADGLAAQAAALCEALKAAEDFGREVATPWYGPETTRTVGTLASLAVTETLVHGRDLACAANKDTSMSRSSAATAVPTVMSAMLPLMFDAKKAGGFHATFEVRVRGSARFGMQIADGAARCFDAGEGAVDCVLTLDPCAALLLGFRRTTLARTILTGGVISTGRKPWLGLKFPGMFVSP